MKIRYFLITVFYLFFIRGSILFAANSHGDAKYRARNVHAGNLIRVTFYNHGMLGRQINDVNVYAGEWPINSGMIQMGNATSFVGTEIQVATEVDSTGDTSLVYITPISMCQGYNPDRFPHDSFGNFLGFEPLPGYLDMSQKEKDPTDAVAMSHEPYTWPNYWPDKMEDTEDPGWAKHWNGYFGKDQRNADEESFYVMDDYQLKKRVSGYDIPLPVSAEPNRGGLGLRQEVRGLQWSNPNAEDCIFWLYDIQNIGESNYAKTVFGLNVGAGMGSSLFASGGDNSDDCATFFRESNLTVNYDWDDVGAGGYSPVPWVGFAFLESPGNATDGIDNDGDGILADGTGKIITTDDFFATYAVGDPIVLIDYDNYERTVATMPADGITFTFNGKEYSKLPGKLLGEIPRNGIDDNLNGIIDESDGAQLTETEETYYLYIRDPYYNDRNYLAIDYFTGAGLTNLLIDERRDDGIDNDGDWDAGVDDVGLDGEPGTGDYGEGDGIPTPGTADFPGETNIDQTDVDESDQIGLTSFIFYVYGTLTYSNDDDMWNVSRPGYFDATLVNVDADYVFSCGYFPLLAGQNEWFSVALIYGWDEEDIVRNKQTVQKIYDSNYNFAVAPDKPTLQAVAGDGKVTLYWNDAAEYSYDRYLRTFDFEGYKIYRSTDPGFTDAGYITDGYGYNYYTVPIAIYDKIDSVYGFFPNSFGTGVQFNLGTETGLVHSFVDSGLTNGKRYYYAVTAYDKGDIEKNIMPSETNMYVAIDAAGNITTGENVISIIPNRPSLGYIKPEFDTQPEPLGTALTSGHALVSFIEPDSICDGHEYEIRFLDQSMDNRDNDCDSLIDGQDPDELLPTVTTGFVVEDLTTSSVSDTVWFIDYLWSDSSGWAEIRNLYDDDDDNPNTLTTILDGIKYFVYNPPAGIIDIPEQNIYDGVKWSENIQYDSSYNVIFSTFNLGGFNPGIDYPRQYRIVFYDEIVGKSHTVYPTLKTTGSAIPVPATDVNFKIFDQQTDEEVTFGFVDATVDASLVPKGHFSAKDRIIFSEKLPDSSSVITVNLLNNAVQDTLFLNYHGRPLGAGDTLYLYPDFPLNHNSKFRFTTVGQKIDPAIAKKSLDEIRVVPNPYVVAAAWEPANPYTSGRGAREIHFINLPMKCTIRIYAVDGTLVRKLEHQSTMTNGTEIWDVLSKDNMEIAYGVYIYHIDAPGIGEKVGRMLIIK